MASVLMLLTSTGACGQRNTSDNWGKLSAIDLILPRLLSPSCRYRGPASPETPTRRSPFLDISLNTERATHATGGGERVEPQTHHSTRRTTTTGTNGQPVARTFNQHGAPLSWTVPLR